MAKQSTFLPQGILTLFVFTLGGILYLFSPVTLPRAGVWYMLMTFVWCVGLAGYNYYPSVRRRRSTQVYPAVFEGPVERYLGVLFWVVDRRLNVVEAGGSGSGAYFGPPSGMVGRSIRVLPGFEASLGRDIQRVLAGEELTSNYHYHGATFRTQFFPIRNKLGEITCCSCITINLSNLYKLDADLALAEQVIEHASDAIAVADPRRQVVSVNNAYTGITGYRSEEVVGRKMILPNGSGLGFGDLKRALQTLEREGALELEVNARRRGGEPYIARLTVSVIRDGGRVTHYLASFADISRLKREKDQLNHLANHDFLTGLPNRRLFLDRLAQAIKRAKRQRKSLVLYFIDLDDFKQVNDFLGHHFGDDLLCQVARRLVNATRDMDTVARLSGDEFVVLVEQVQGEREIVEVGEKLLGCFQPVFRSGDHQASCSASLGIAVFPDDGEDMDGLMAVADAGMYRAKEVGDNCFYFRGSHCRLDTVIEKFQPLEISRAIRRNEFELQYQPQIDLRDNAIAGCEVLVRWNHSNGTQLLPGEFLPLVEEGALVLSLGRWVLKTAATQFFHWHNDGVRPDSLAINLAPAQLRDEGLLVLADELIATGRIRHRQLLFEVSVDLALEEPHLVEGFFRRCSAMGIRCALDEFGAGEAGFQLLGCLKPDVVKLDRRLIQASRGSQNAKAVMAAIAALGDVLGFDVVGVGVEQERQLDNLNLAGCHLVQGYYYAPSLNVEDFSRFYRAFYR